MNSFTLFYTNDNLSKKVVELINEYELNNSFKSIEISPNNLSIYKKHIKSVPAIVDNSSNIVIEKDKVLEFIVRLNLHINKNKDKNKLIPYNNVSSSYTDYYSNYDNNSDKNSSLNIILYSNSAFHYINNEIPKIETLTETPLLSIKSFEKQYKELLNERDA